MLLEQGESPVEIVGRRDQDVNACRYRGAMWAASARDRLRART